VVGLLSCGPESKRLPVALVRRNILMGRNKC